MDIQKLISISVTLAVLTVSTGQTPGIKGCKVSSIAADKRFSGIQMGNPIASPE